MFGQNVDFESDLISTFGYLYFLKPILKEAFLIPISQWGKEHLTPSNPAKENYLQVQYDDTEHLSAPSINTTFTERYVMEIPPEPHLYDAILLYASYIKLVSLTGQATVKTYLIVDGIEFPGPQMVFTAIGSKEFIWKLNPRTNRRWFYSEFNYLGIRIDVKTTSTVQLGRVNAKIYYSGFQMPHVQEEMIIHQGREFEGILNRETERNVETESTL